VAIRHAGQNGPAYPFWLEIQRITGRLEMSIREVSDRSKVPVTTINRLQTSPARDRASRIRAVRKLAKALNQASVELAPEQDLPFPEEAEVLRLAGLAEPALDDSISVREAVQRSTEYSEAQRRALLSLLDAFDSERE
jgi:hypothetical protein